MKRKLTVLITLVALIILVTGLYLFTDAISKFTGYLMGESETEKLANCLKEQSAEFYTNQYCADCEKQKDIFGRSIKIINEVDCGKEKKLCPNIREIPAWYIHKKIHYGIKTLDEIKELSGCTEE